MAGAEPPAYIWFCGRQVAAPTLGLCGRREQSPRPTFSKMEIAGFSAGKSMLSSVEGKQRQQQAALSLLPGFPFRSNGPVYFYI